MEEYPKIQTVFKRDPETKYKTLLEGQWSLPELWYLQNTNWFFTEKVDGTNIRVIYSNRNFEFRGKTDKAQIPPFLLERLEYEFNKKTDTFDWLFGLNEIYFYGEGYGAKIQKGGGNYRQDQGFVLFDIKIDGWWLKRKAVEDIAAKLGIDIVPIIGSGTLWDMVKLVREGFKSRWGDFLAEGIVARPEVQLFNRKGERIITKLKHKDFK